jgi:hypothetical protein
MSFLFLAVMNSLSQIRSFFPRRMLLKSHGSWCHVRTLERVFCHPGGATPRHLALTIWKRNGVD